MTSENTTGQFICTDCDATYKREGMFARHISSTGHMQRSVEEAPSEVEPVEETKPATLRTDGIIYALRLKGEGPHMTILESVKVYRHIANAAEAGAHWMLKHRIFAGQLVLLNATTKEVVKVMGDDEVERYASKTGACGDACKTSTSEQCTCVCGGANHGTFA